MRPLTFVNIKADWENPFWVNLSRIEAIGVGSRAPLVHIVGWDDVVEATRWDSIDAMLATLMEAVSGASA